MFLKGIALHEALGMDIKWRSARHSAALNQLELSEIEKTLRYFSAWQTHIRFS